MKEDNIEMKRKEKEERERMGKEIQQKFKLALEELEREELTRKQEVKGTKETIQKLEKKKQELKIGLQNYQGDQIDQFELEDLCTELENKLG